MQKLLVFVAFAVFVSIVQSVPTFTGHADADFDASQLTTRDVASYHKFNNTDPINVIAYMAQNGRRSGVDIDAIHMVYDDTQDTMYVGIQCAAICGDIDGDGNPGGVDPNAPLDNLGASTLGTDTNNMCSSEHISLMFWNNAPEDYIPIQAGQSPYFFFPTMVVGVEYFECLVTSAGVQKFLAYEVPNYRNCMWPIPRDQPTASCVNDTRRRVASPGTRNTGVYPNPAKILSDVWQTNSSYRPVSPPELFTRYPNITHPHIEFKLRNFSHYPEFDFVPGYTKMRFALQGAAGSSADKNGEDLVRSEIWELGWDCDHWPGGNKVYDACGVCGGDSSTCADCSGVPNGNKVYDLCGVCDGGNLACRDCSGVPNGPKKYDACGVCNGNNATCLDCAYKPNGNTKYDVCGVCGGNGQSCWDCARTPNGPARYDVCGVCGGDTTSCQDCFGTPNGPYKYDECGVCAGNGQSCADPECTFGHWDVCGVCNGTASTCCYNYLGIKNELWDYILLPAAVGDMIERLEKTWAVVDWIHSNLPEYEDLDHEQVTDDSLCLLAELNRVFLQDCGLFEFCSDSGRFLTHLQHATSNYLI